ncbi:unnamed protein product [Polarella glacialis]|uniref:Uncharacterized protein n=1 Tax=Polarella glacialis TaxID=89957 RepID=A0A813G2R8_POLGL|nr:unnamed protein product [Polarella glacialis]
MLRWSASALQSLFEQGGEDVARVAVAYGAAETLVTCMATNAGEAELEERCLAAVATLAQKGGIAAVLAVLDAGGQSAADEAITRHPGSTEIQNWAEALFLSVESCADEETGELPGGFVRGEDTSEFHGFLHQDLRPPTIPEASDPHADIEF